MSDDPRLVALWALDGDLGAILAEVRGHETEWLVEKGVLREEVPEESRGSLASIDHLIVGDVVYRAGTPRLFYGSARRTSTLPATEAETGEGDGAGREARGQRAEGNTFAPLALGDPRNPFFWWYLLDPVTGAVQSRAWEPYTEWRKTPDGRFTEEHKRVRRSP